MAKMRCCTRLVPSRFTTDDFMILYFKLTSEFPTVSYALVPVCAKLVNFGLLDQIAQD